MIASVGVTPGIPIVSKGDVSPVSTAVRIITDARQTNSAAVPMRGSHPVCPPPIVNARAVVSPVEVEAHPPVTKPASAFVISPSIDPALKMAERPSVPTRVNAFSARTMLIAGPMNYAVIRSASQRDAIPNVKHVVSRVHPSDRYPGHKAHPVARTDSASAANLVKMRT